MVLLPPAANALVVPNRWSASRVGLIDGTSRDILRANRGPGATLHLRNWKKRDG